MSAHHDLREHHDALDPRALATDVDLAFIGDYHGYSELAARWLALTTERGVRARIIGHSADGAPLFVLLIGPDMAPRTSVLMAGLHPIEWIGVETMLALLERLAADPPMDRRIVAFPLVNVDGYRRVEADLRHRRRRWRRTNSRGVDLNRNFPTHFKRRRIRLLAGYNHSGPVPLSEPEVAAVVSTLDCEATRSHIDIGLSLHSFGRMILIPYGGVWRAPHDAEQHYQAAAEVHARLGEPYHIRQCSRWVPGSFARGMEIDHLHDAYGATALLIECSRGGVRLTSPASLLQPFCWYNPPDPGDQAADIAAALEPLARGQVPAPA